MNDKEGCLAYTKAGARCKNHPVQGKKFCNIHLNQANTLQDLCSMDNDVFIGFVLGLLTETVIGDGYDLLKNNLMSIGSVSTRAKESSDCLNKQPINTPVRLIWHRENLELEPLLSLELLEGDLYITDLSGEAG